MVQSERANLLSLSCFPSFLSSLLSLSLVFLSLRSPCPFLPLLSPRAPSLLSVLSSRLMLSLFVPCPVPFSLNPFVLVLPPPLYFRIPALISPLQLSPALISRLPAHCRNKATTDSDMNTGFRIRVVVSRRASERARDRDRENGPGGGEKGEGEGQNERGERWERENERASPVPLLCLCNSILLPRLSAPLRRSSRP